MSKFKDIIIESLTDEDNIQNLLNIIKPELTEQCSGLTINEDGTIRIKLFDSAYTIKLQPISITTQEEEEFNEENETVVQNNNSTLKTQGQNAIRPEMIATLQSLSNSPDPQIANSAKASYNSLSKNIAEYGKRMVDKTNKMLSNLNNYKI